jgi:beta-phosphoglucomutase-like phosphatase (HAD superfamily)
MPRTARRVTAAPHYVATATGGRHQVTDRVNGYALSEHADPQAADRAAQLLNTDPAAAVAAVRALDDAQTGPAADARRAARAGALLSTEPVHARSRWIDKVAACRLTVTPR